ncbi:hypothetical protein M438DRAFT_104076 [Aureobasidium pullulans EXF-150]|uniref:Uncharacterized protein n=1 Tax=Aureobasidium pullulans EXF-150 TaxID=1043002 RepID=A0A074XFQ2_AURPU|nr:uncharacterized protein M438DRAFT_104076 [Aureobasidium pullulans EXF-150]KEQ80892.1 hypothetical protein M438DRAFT_104076 [Aureobasidium pullulans EXF-150]
MRQYPSLYSSPRFLLALWFNVVVSIHLARSRVWTTQHNPGESSSGYRAELATGQMEKKRCLETRQKSKQKSSPFPFFSMSRVFKVCADDPSTRLYGLALNMSAENGSSHNGFSLRFSSRWHKTLKPRVFFARSRL